MNDNGILIEISRLADLPRYSNLIEILEEKNENIPENIAIVYGNRVETYKDLWVGINRFGQYLVGKGIQSKDNIAICIPNSVEFFYAYYGCQLIGAVPVPVYFNSSLKKISSIMGICGAKGLVLIRSKNSFGLDEIASILFVEDSFNMRIEEVNRFSIQSRDLAMLQFTSGSTGDPKGVMLSHFNLIYNLNQMVCVFKLNKSEVFVSWLPLSHDMGLIMMSMLPLIMGAKLILLDTTPSPKPWLNAIEKYQGTYTASPDFGYRFAIKFSPTGFNPDLSSLKVAVIAAEPVRKKTIVEFEKKFKLSGILRPGYGLAENSVGVCGYDRKEIEFDDLGNANCGSTDKYIQLKIVGENNIIQEQGNVGEICIKSHSMTSGYYKNKAETEELFDDFGFFRTGDLGYLNEDKELFVVGRKKNVFICAGRNVSPREFEEVIEEFPGVNKSAAVSFVSEFIDGEIVYALVELDRKHLIDAEAKEELKNSITQKIKTELGYIIKDLFFVEYLRIPKTSSGKTKYDEVKNYIAKLI